MNQFAYILGYLFGSFAGCNHLLTSDGFPEFYLKLLALRCTEFCRKHSLFKIHFYAEFLP